ncbi:MULTISPECIES: DUF1934 domain-containing protein [Fusobacterium]|uniref:DUF1934 domain-containing protein n=1 Tax=Fusobacterium TaxID=848 RepID=UPI001F252BC9|nr:MULTISPECIES: DUF1934 domain-containing protein [Fusobacterium]MCF2612278.1 DUF1934 domain-containing protein [Fusobacterium perfoetens]MDY2980825.1 DUF1934 family protein [Fusobacterium sp.]
MKVSLKIKTFEESNELLEKVVKALKRQEGNYISYTYVDEFGKNIVKIFKDSVIIERRGKVESSLVLKKDCQTELQYISEYLNMNLILFTKKLNIRDEGFESEYVLYQEREIINKIFISIEELL